MADWSTINDSTRILHNGDLVTSKIDPMGELMPDAYTNPAFRSSHHSRPTAVSSDRFTRQNHVMENHLVFDNKTTKDEFLEDSEKRNRKNGSIAVRRVYKEKHLSKYATTRISNESVLLNPINLVSNNLVSSHEKTSTNNFRENQISDLRKSGAKVSHTTSRPRHHSAPVMFMSRSKSPRQQILTSSNGWGPGLAGGRSSGTFKRYRSNIDTKEDCISFFDIETEKVEKYQYRPGEEVAGAIKIIVKKNFEIRYVELVVVGQGHLTLTNSKDGLPKTIRETYLHKQTFVIGTSDAAWTSVLTAGHYTSKYRVKLPEGLPSTVHHDDPTNGFTFEVKYTLIARMCDDAMRSSVRSTSSMHSNQGRMRVILAKKANFHVQRSFDINNVPNGLDPVMHKEQLWLSCAHQDAAIVSVQLDRSVFLAGDDIRMRLIASLPGSHRVKDITCSLQEHVVIDTTSDPLTFTLSHMICKDPSHRGYKPSASTVEENTYDVTIPTQTNLISSFAVPKATFKVKYSLSILLKFSNSGGKLSFKVPIDIGPCAEPIYAEKNSSGKVVPLFNRATRFPCFSPTPPTGSSTPRQTSALDTSSLSVPVESKYTNSLWSRCFLCCIRTTTSTD